MGDSYSKEFATSSPTSQAAADADSLPVATADFVGTGTGAMALTVTNVATGLYRITGTIPAGRARGDVLNVSVAATVGGIAGKAAVDTQVIDSRRVGDLNDSPAAPAATAIATAVWQDSTAGDFTAAGSIGKSLYTAGVVPGAAGGLFIAGTNAATVVTTSFTSTFAGNLTGSVSGVTNGVTLASAGLDAITIESGINARQALSPILAASAGALSGAGSGTITIKGGNAPSTTRITASTDSSGNRSSITLNLPA